MFNPGAVALIDSPIAVNPGTCAIVGLLPPVAATATTTQTNRHHDNSGHNRRRYFDLRR